VVRKHVYARREAGLEERLVREHADRYFLVPLQVHNDAQVTVHSNYGAVEPFVREVIASFAANAAPETVLVLKHHPLDRAYHDYTGVIREAASAAGVAHRVHSIHDQHLPTLLEHARGAVVINSTVGLQALDHRTPLKVCGRALYDMRGLTYQGSLDSFWGSAHRFEVDDELFVAFKRALVLESQLGGSFYRAQRSGEALEVLGTRTVDVLPPSVPREVAAAAE
jgi:capsular polysaccharide export protein